MKKIEKRAFLCLLLGLVLLAGLCYFVYEDWHDGGEWAVYEGNRDVYADGDLAKGAVYDRYGNLLMRNTADGIIFNDDADVRAGCMHITGDKDNNIATGANRVFLDRLIGFDFINGIYSLNNDGEDVYLTLDGDVCATAYRALAGRKGTVGVYNYKTGELVCMVSSPTYDPQDPPSTIPEGAYINRFISAAFAPGSTFKLLTAAASIETQTMRTATKSIAKAASIMAMVMRLQTFPSTEQSTSRRLLRCPATVTSRNSPKRSEAKPSKSMSTRLVLTRATTLTVSRRKPARSITLTEVSISPGPASASGMTWSTLVL